MRLANKLVILVESIVVVAIIIGGISTFIISRKVLIDKTKQQLTSISVLKENNIKRFIEEIKVEIEYLTINPKSNSLFVKYINSNGLDYREEAFDIVLDIVKHKKILHSVYLTDNEGRVLLSTHSEDVGKFKSNEEFFVNGKKNTYLQNFYFDTTINKTAILVSVPILDSDGNFLGVVAGRVNTEEISNLMTERSGLGKSGETFLVNSSNVVVTDLLKDPDAALKKTIFLPQITECLSGKSNFEGRIDYTNDKVLGYWYWFPELNSCLVSKIDSSEAFLELRQVVYMLLVTAGIIALLVGFMGYMVGKFIAAPIVEMRNVANQIEKGNLSARTNIKSGDEIGELSNSLNDMAVNLESLYSGLEKKVEDRTNEINSKLLLIEDQNKNLAENKSAMLNLLEDAKKLEDELKAEKLSVEKKVDERTKEVGEGKAKLLAAIEALSKAFVMIDLNGGIVLVNENLNKIFNTEKQNWMLSDIQEQLGTSFDFVKAYKKNIIEKKKIIYDDIAFGSRVLQIRFSPVFSDRTGEKIISGILAIIGDLTDEKVLERSKDEFFSIASHELRTPLTAIRGNTSMILDYYKEQVKDPDLNQMVTDTHDASIRLIGIVNDFLDLSRLEQKRMEYKKSEFKILDVVLSVIKELKVSAEEKGVKLNTDVDKDVKVNADPDKVKQILFNIIGNSLKFTEKGSVNISSSVEDNKIKISVTDTGVGISKESQSLLFRKFQQAGKSTITRDGAKGTGLGLYISKLMIEGMGGQIALESSVEGKGSVFTFTLPVAIN